MGYAFMLEALKNPGLGSALYNLGFEPWHLIMVCFKFPAVNVLKVQFFFFTRI
jgi:hypothetical protein